MKLPTKPTSKKKKKHLKVPLLFYSNNGALKHNRNINSISKDGIKFTKTERKRNQ